MRIAEVNTVCPLCERIRPAFVDLDAGLKIRHSGHYELTCATCVFPLLGVPANASVAEGN